jgi:soluble P-type ATPase
MLRRLADQLTIHVITADTFGSVAAQMADLPISLKIITPDKQDEQKRDFAAGLDGDTVAIGNGFNDNKMLSMATLGIAVILREGASAVTVQAADMVCTDILSALELLEHPKRLIATLRR